MSAIATLTIDLIANSAKFVEGLQQSSKKSKDWSSQVRSSADVAAKSFLAMSATATAALTALIATSAQSADKLASTADALGITTEALAGLHHAGVMANVSVETMDKAISKMNKSIGEAANNGTGAAADALEQLGLSAQELVAMSPDQKLGAIADAMQSVENRSQQAALAAALFGKESTGMLNVLDLGSAGLADMSAEAEALGLTLSRVEAAKIEQMNDAFDRGKAVVSGFGLQITQKLSPVITALINQAVDWAKETNFVGEASDEVFNAIQKGAAFGADAIRGLSIAWQYVKLAVLEVASFSLDAAEKMYKAYLYVKSAITGEKINYEDTFLADLNRNAEEQIALTKNKIDELALAPLPSDQINKFFEEAKRKATELAEQTAAAAQGRIDDSAYTDMDTAAEESARKKEQREKEMADRKAQQDAERFAQQLQSVELSLMTEEERLYESYMRRSQIITEALQRDQITAQTYNDLQAENDRKYQDEKNNLALKNEELQRKAIDNVAGLQNSHNKQMAAAGKAAFFAKKLLLTKEAIIAGKVAVQHAWASASFPFNLPAVALAVAETAANVAGIQGIAHGGMDNIPSESTYLLDQGERVLSRKQNQDLTGYLQRENDNGSGGASPPIIAVVSNIDEAKAWVASQDGRDAIILTLGKEPERMRSELKIA